ncbi:MAG: squalene/phytoene synthase family protein [Thermaurantiacus sp.]
MSSMVAGLRQPYLRAVVDGPSFPGALWHVGSELKARDRERWLSCLWAPADARPALMAVHALDSEMARVVADVREPLLAEIRLAWWREQVQAVADGAAPPPQPLLQLLATEARPRVDLARLTRLEDAFLPLVSAGPLDQREHCRLRGQTLFEALFAACMREDAVGRAAARAAGTLWASAELWRGRRTAHQGALSLNRGTGSPAGEPLSDAQLRELPVPLRALAALALHDHDASMSGRSPPPRATAGRQLRMARAALLAR